MVSPSVPFRSLGRRATLSVLAVALLVLLFSVERYFSDGYGQRPFPLAVVFAIELARWALWLPALPRLASLGRRLGGDTTRRAAIVFLPASAKPVPTEEAVATPVARGGTECILLAEDEEVQ